MRPNVNQLWKYANKIARRAEKAGLGTQYPTIRQAAKRFNCKQSDIFECAGEGIQEGDHYLGTASYFCEPPEAPGDHVVEAY